MSEVSVEKQIGDQVFSITTGYLAKQAAGSCVVRYGDTVVFAASVSGPGRPGIDFFPLTVDYRERTAAAGKFPGGFIKREGRPTTKEILTSRLCDRPIRPLFPAWYRDEVQIQTVVLASDRQNDADVLSMNACSACLHIAPIPFQGPIGAVRLGRINNQWVIFPTQDQLEESDLDLVVAGSKTAVLMIEGFAREMPEQEMGDAVMYAHDVIKQLCDLQDELLVKTGRVKPVVEAPPSNGLLEKLKAGYYDAYLVAKQTPGKQARAEACKALKEQAIAALNPELEAEGAFTVAEFSTAWHDLTEIVVRDLIMAGTRPDGRNHTQLRPIECRVDVLPRVHGSAIFQRGETQSLITVALGTTRDEQRVDGLIEEYAKKFMLDYNFPSYSVGEVRPIRGPGRREIGHGALAERSVKPILPDPEEFPYTIRVISDIMESNGSSSMASVCGATLGLMAAGVPIHNPVAGISIGLVQQSADKWILLTDIIGDEDHFGDMDYKVAGTQNGVTGIQLDLKIAGITEPVIRGALAQAREARMEILRNMLSVISQPRAEISGYAPRLYRTSINPEKIGMLIGPGGKNIRAIQESTGTTIEVEDDGTVTISGNDAEGAKAALRRVEQMTESVKVGRIYEGRVTSVKDFGAFVEILPGKDGLCHISELSDDYVRSVSDICKVGDEIHVKVIAIDEQDRVKLSRKLALREMNPPAETPAPAVEGD